MVKNQIPRQPPAVKRMTDEEIEQRKAETDGWRTRFGDFVNSLKFWKESQPELEGKTMLLLL